MIVVWRVTERCNYACAFCAFDRTQPRTRREAEPRTVARLGELLGQYRADRGERVLVCWLGGEPLLWAPLWAISRDLRASGVDISVTTNGSTLHLPATRAAVIAYVSELTISVDGFAGFHERVRGAPGAWLRLRAAAQSLVRERAASGSSLLLRANVVLMHDNLDQFAALCRELADWGIAEITFNQLGGRDRPQFHAAHRLTPGDALALATLVPELRAELAARGVRLRGSATYLERIAASAADLALPVTDCARGERFLFIDETGTLSPCSFTSGELGLPLAGVMHVNDLIGLPDAFAARRTAQAPQACRDCPSTQVFAKFGA